LFCWCSNSLESQVNGSGKGQQGESEDEIDFGGKQNRTEKAGKEDSNSDAGRRTRNVDSLLGSICASPGQQQDQLARPESRDGRSTDRKSRRSRPGTQDPQVNYGRQKSFKVRARNGTVMLKGPVRTDEEKSAIEAKAVEITGAANVKSEITVKSKTAN
jgi:hypothetical protein